MLVEALTAPAAKAFVLALATGDESALSDLPGEVLDALVAEVFGEADRYGAQLTALNDQLHTVIEQDFSRDFGGARLALRDAARTSSAGDREAALLEAWSLLRRAVSGTNDPMRKVDCHLLAASVALLRERLDDAIDRSQMARSAALAAVFQTYASYRFPHPQPVDIGSVVRTWLRPDVTGEPARLVLARACREACDRADEASTLLGEFGQRGHPVHFRALSERQWVGVDVRPQDSIPTVTFALRASGTHAALPMSWIVERKGLRVGLDNDHVTENSGSHAVRPQIQVSRIEEGDMLRTGMAEPERKQSSPFAASVQAFGGPSRWLEVRTQQLAVQQPSSFIVYLTRPPITGLRDDLMATGWPQ